MNTENRVIKTLQKEGLIHFGIWAIFFLILFLQVYFNTGKLPIPFLGMLVVGMVGFYINYLVLVPQFLLNKKNILYFSSVIVLLILAVYAIEYIMPKPEFMENLPKPPNFPDPGMDPEFNPEMKPEMKPDFRGIHFGFPIFFNAILYVIGTAIKMYLEWDKNEQLKKDIESQNSNAELHFLKNQLSPHFLFNSLNSIYSLTTKKSNDAPEAIIMLSELMRYMLYQADNDFVLLKDELDYIQNYLKLQRLRIANNENVKLRISGGVTHQKIRPLLLIPFIENAFKYGTDYKGNTLVHIEITIDGDILNFNCVNLIGNRKKDPENSGIGLQNTKERLQLLYPNQHELTIKENNDQFQVHLNLNLSQ